MRQSGHRWSVSSLGSVDGIQIGEYSIPSTELEENFETSSGPGGQHANRNETAVRLRFRVRESSLPEEVKQTLIDRLGETIEVRASDSRSQFRNRALARERLEEKLERALRRRTRRRRTRLSQTAKRKRVADKRARGKVKKLRQRPTADD